MEQPKVSVIIPVYGVEKYIERCARSLFEQTMQEGIEYVSSMTACRTEALRYWKKSSKNIRIANRKSKSFDIRRIKVPAAHEERV